MPGLFGAILERRMVRVLLPTLAVSALMVAPFAWAAAPTSPVQPASAAPSAAASSLDGLKYRLVGPFRGGRATGVAGVVGDPTTYYFGAAAGGLWKTVDGGVTWKPLWDKFPEAAPAVGAVAVAPSDPKIVYAGTGEANIRGNVVAGNGLYKSTDAGKTWHFSGLRDSGAIGRIVVDAKDPNVVFVAALGHPFAANAERGVFKSTDGGATWRKVLFVDDKTGAIDVAVTPGDPRVMWAGMWQAYRKPWIMESGGPGSGLYKSTDGGETWTRQAGAGLPDGILGRINVAPTADPKRVYAMIEAGKGGLFRTDDGGASWALVNAKNAYRQRAWYFNTVFTDPKSPDGVYVLNTDAYHSVDAGKTFKKLPTRHGDNHELWIDPTNPTRMIEGNDGGANVSVDGGKTWTTENNQPTAQFYHVSTDNEFPFHLLGAQQDNSTIEIASAGRSGGVGIEDWFPVGGGESGFVIPDPTDPNIVYAGGYDAQLTRYDRRTDDLREITPYARNTMGWAPKDLEYRFQWTAPILVSRYAPHAIYFAAQVLFRSLDQGSSWTIVSPDLTRDDKSRQQSSGGPLTKDNTSVETYGTIFALAESPVDPQLMWAGSDDGMVHLTRDGAKSWTDATPKDMPDGATVEVIEPGAAPGTAYMAADRHRLDDPRPYVWRTRDFGANWTRIGEGLPNDAYVHVVRTDPVVPGLLYLGNERGVWLSRDDGDHWAALKLNLPVVPVHDLAVHGSSLAVATHGRAFWMLDDLAPVRQWRPAIAAEPVHLFQPDPAPRGTFPTRPDSMREPGGANPPAGAIIDYWLNASVGTVRPAPDAPELDEEAKKKLAEAPDPFDKRIRLDILDAKGDVIRTFPDPKQLPPDPDSDDDRPPPPRLPHLAGFNSFVWDLRVEGATPIAKAPLWAGTTAGAKALAGHYQVRLTVDGKSQTQGFDITPDPRTTASQADLERQFALQSAVDAELSAAHEAVLEIRAARAKLEASKTAGSDALIARMTALEEVLIQPRAHASEDALNYPVQLNNMLAALASLVASGEDAPTASQEALFKELKGKTDAVLVEWRDLKGTLPT
jgi:photosystem II stability/assembly factor-like uncharacterized protein